MWQTCTSISSEGGVGFGGPHDLCPHCRSECSICTNACCKGGRLVTKRREHDNRRRCPPCWWDVYRAMEQVARGARVCRMPEACSCIIRDFVETGANGPYPLVELDA